MTPLLFYKLRLQTRRLDKETPLAVEQGEQGQDDRGTLGGPSSDQATPDRDDSGPWSTCLGLRPTLGQFTERERRLGRC